MRFPGANNPSSHRAVVDTHFENKMIEALLVDARQCFLQLQGEFDESGQVTPPRSILGLLRVCNSGCRHVCRAYRLDLDDVLEFSLIEDLTKEETEMESR